MSKKAVLRQQEKQFRQLLKEFGVTSKHAAPISPEEQKKIDKLFPR